MKQLVKAFGLGVIEVTVGLRHRQLFEAQPAEECVAPPTRHLIATVALLDRGLAMRALLGHIFQPFLGGHLLQSAGQLPFAVQLFQLDPIGSYEVITYQSPFQPM